MGMVTDVLWQCPGCLKDNIAQLYDDHYEVAADDGMCKPLSHKCIPIEARGLKWNPPCEKCGEFQLVDPPAWIVYVECPIVPYKENT
jgi:hypothetical protein